MADDTKNVDPEETFEDQSFYNPALVGSGTALPEGGIGDPLPDPTLVHGILLPEGPRTTRRQFADTAPEQREDGPAKSETVTTPAPKKASTSTTSK